jgi:subtilisin family serine protease
VTAPGGDRMSAAPTPSANGRILSTVVGGGYGYLQGTSMASPAAAGVVALIRGRHPGWSADRVAASLYAKADRIPCPPGGVYDPPAPVPSPATCQGGPSGKGFYGAGLVDALDAVTR